MSIRTMSSRLLAAALALGGLSVGQTTGNFNFLTYNVAGLPAIINNNEVPGDKGTNANLIGTVLATQKYDIVHMQEDFNYHAYIYATDNHPYRTPTSGGVPFGDGLNTVANYDWTGLVRKKWNKCNLNSGDCLTPKGFSFMRMKIQSIEVDLYNLHADAGYVSRLIYIGWKLTIRHLARTKVMSMLVLQVSIRSWPTSTQTPREGP